MGKITHASHETYPMIRKGLAEAISRFAAETGLKVELGKATLYTDRHAIIFKVEVSGEGARPVEEIALEQMMEMFCITDPKIRLNGVEYTLVGYRNRARNKPWIVEKAGTKGKFILSDEQVEHAIGRKLTDDPTVVTLKKEVK